MKHTNRRLLLVLDAQGGGMGAQLIKRLAPALPPDCDLLAVGTNVLATNAMLKAGAPRGATGENAVVYNAARADVIVGPIGMVLAVDPSQADSCMEAIREAGETPYVLGEVQAGEKGVTLC